jgi:hypothetical protein
MDIAVQVVKITHKGRTFRRSVDPTSFSWAQFRKWAVECFPTVSSVTDHVLIYADEDGDHCTIVAGKDLLEALMSHHRNRRPLRITIYAKDEAETTPAPVPAPAPATPSMAVSETPLQRSVSDVSSVTSAASTAAAAPMPDLHVPVEVAVLLERLLEAPVQKLAQKGLACADRAIPTIMAALQSSEVMAALGPLHETILEAAQCVVQMKEELTASCCHGEAAPVSSTAEVAEEEDRKMPAVAQEGGAAAPVPAAVSGGAEELLEPAHVDERSASGSGDWKQVGLMAADSLDVRCETEEVTSFMTSGARGCHVPRGGAQGRDLRWVPHSGLHRCALQGGLGLA